VLSSIKVWSFFKKFLILLKTFLIIDRSGLIFFVKGVGKHKIIKSAKRIFDRSFILYNFFLFIILISLFLRSEIYDKLFFSLEILLLSISNPNTLIFFLDNKCKSGKPTYPRPIIATVGFFFKFINMFNN